MLTKLHRTTLTEQAVQSLIDYIATADLKPGEALPAEAKLAIELGVSRQVVREAIKSLEGQGILSMINGKGAIVKPIDAGPLQTFFRHAVQLDTNAILELIEVRQGIEVQSAILAAQRRTPEELAQLTEIVAQMGRALKELDAYIELDASLHLHIAQTTHNAMLYHLVQSLHNSARDSIRAGLQHRRTEQELERVQQLHEVILQEIARGDAQGAARAMTLHFDDAVTAMVGKSATGQA
ncbi:MAG TPA: FadR/GntR family transcriptional regulator [Ktedonobacteraceae bacterium]|nr:FadR/GntR family transcriptional regulator [Ktedonobacteraceae bacterium]